MVTTRPFSLSYRRVLRADRGLIVLLAAFVLLLPLWTPRLYATDSVQYYAYLRSLFFDGDLDFRNEYARFHALNPNSGIDKALLPRRDPGTGKLLNVDPATQRLVNVAPIGSAVLWMPAFVLAHGAVLLARAAGSSIAADGYSAPYIWAVCMASALYGLFGLLLSYRVARRYTGVWPATAATLACWLASPLIFYMYVSPPWSHTASLFATALFLWFWLDTPNHRTVRQWIVLGALGGLMVLTREQLGLFLLLPALESLAQYWAVLRTRNWRDLRRQIVTHALFLLVFLAVLAPQFVTYLILNGRLGPSTVVLEKLRKVPADPFAHGLLGSAHFWDTLVDARPSPETGNWFAHGAFVWSPVWALGVLGLCWLWRRDSWLTVSLLLAFAGQVWVNGRFGTTWHLSGAFGFRRLIEATPVFVLGMALLIERLRLPRAAWAGLIALLIAWNIGLMFQWTVMGGEYRKGLVWRGMITRQLSVPLAASRRIEQLMFDRCALVENGTCR